MVEEVFVRLGRVLWLTVNSQRIGTTSEHPFYSPVHGWCNAGDLSVGASVLLRDGSYGVIEGMEAGEYATVYNLRVSDWHTYFVGEDEWGFEVWAHNASYSTPELARAAKALREKRTNEIVVKDANQVREVFFREFRSGRGAPTYRDTTGWSKAQVDVHGKAGTHHWDTTFDRTSTHDAMKGQPVLKGHYNDGKTHNYTPHLQIHTHDGRVVRILYGG